MQAVQLILKSRQLITEFGVLLKEHCKNPIEFSKTFVEFDKWGIAFVQLIAAFDKCTVKFTCLPAPLDKLTDQFYKYTCCMAHWPHFAMHDV